MTRLLHGTLGFVPNTLEFYIRAFSHKSVGKENDRGFYNNERLEYLGDAVLGAVIAEYLFKKYPSKDEGFLTKMRSNIVNRRVLNDIADQMGLEVFLRHCGLAHISESMLGNAFEAFIGAIYLDVGYDKTKRFIIGKMIKDYLNIHQLETVNNNFKSILLEYCQKNQKSVYYQLVRQFKQNNRDRFRVAVKINDKEFSVGEDFSKKSAEQLASQIALAKLGLLPEEDAEQ